MHATDGTSFEVDMHISTALHQTGKQCLFTYNALCFLKTSDIFIARCHPYYNWRYVNIHHAAIDDMVTHACMDIRVHQHVYVTMHDTAQCCKFMYGISQ